MHCSILRQYSLPTNCKQSKKKKLEIGKDWNEMVSIHTHTHTHTHKHCTGYKTGTSGLTNVCLRLDWSHRFWPTRTLW